MQGHKAQGWWLTAQRPSVSIFSFFASHGEMRRQVTQLFTKIFQLNFVCTRGILEAEISQCDLISNFPVSKLDAVLRDIRNAPGCYGVTAGIRPLTLCDPNLKIDFLLSKGEKVAFDTTNHAAAQILDIDDIEHQLVVYIRQEEICSRKWSMIFVSQFIYQDINGARHIHLHIQICGLSK